MNIPKLVAKARLMYHANMLDVNNVLNQLHIISDQQAERSNKDHTMAIVTDILPRIFGEETVDKFFEEKGAK